MAFKRLWGLTAALVAAGCATDSPVSMVSEPTPELQAVTGSTGYTVDLCKYWYGEPGASPVDTYQFSFEASLGDPASGTAVRIVDDCGPLRSAEGVYSWPAGTQLTITEIVPPGTRLLEIHTYARVGGSLLNVITHPQNNSVTIDVSEVYAVSFKNVERPSDPPVGRIGDYVWLDGNEDGIQDGSETGLVNIPVELLQGGSVIASALTDASGGYLFDNLSAGCYTVTAATPAGMAASPSEVGGASTDSNGSPADVCLPTNSSEDLTIDFGFVLLPPPPTGVCEGGVTKLVLRYVGAGPVPGAVAGQRRNPGRSGILPAQVSGSGASTLYTFAISSLGGLFTSVANGRIGNNFVLYADGMQIVDFHTSCSAPIYPGMVLGNMFEIVEVYSVGGQIGPIQP